MLATLLSSYDKLLASFPADWQGPISLILTLALAGAIWHVVKKSGLWLILLLVLVPALIPTLKGVGQFVIQLLKELLSRAAT